MRNMVQRRSAFAVALVAAIASSTQALGQQTAPKPGTTFHYDGASWQGRRGTDADAVRSESVAQILRVEGDVIWTVTVTAAAGRTVALPIRMFRGLFSYEFEFDNVTFRNEIDFAKAGTLWPLEVGRSLTLMGPRSSKRGAEAFRSSGATYTLRLSVLRREMIETPAGTFDAVVIGRSLERMDHEEKMQDREESTTWYVPALGWYARHDSHRESYSPTTGQRTTAAASSVILRQVNAPP
jgi:hypothetical protein